MNLRYHWKALLLGGLALGAALLILTFAAQATPARPTCDEWDEAWFHHFAEEPGTVLF